MAAIVSDAGPLFKASGWKVVGAAVEHLDPDDLGARRAPVGPLDQPGHRTRGPLFLNLQRRQTQVPLGLKLQQKTTSREVLEPATLIPPAPVITQLPRQSFATPFWMIFYPSGWPAELFLPKTAALNH